MKKHQNTRNLNRSILLGFMLLGVVIIVGYLIIEGRNNSQPSTDEQGRSALKQEAESVAKSLNGSLEDANVTRDECTNHKFTRVCYFDTTVNSSHSDVSDLESQVASNGWSKDQRSGYDEYFKNLNYKYCHSLLKIEEAEDMLEINIHCYTTIE